MITSTGGTIRQYPRARQAQAIARTAFNQRAAEPVQSFRRWTLAAILMQRAYYAAQRPT